MRLHKIVTVAGIVTFAAAAVMGNTKCATGIGANGSGTGVSGSGGGAAVIVANPVGRTGGVWVGARDGSGYSWLAAAAAAGAAGKALAVIHNNEGRSVPAGGVATTSGKSRGFVPYASTAKCHDPDSQADVVDRWIWGAGSSPNIKHIFITCFGINLSRNRSGKPGRGKQIMSCITWVLARGEEQITGKLPNVVGDTSTWEWNGAKVIVSTNTGRILGALPGAMTWAQCAAGGSGGGPAPA